MIPPHTARKLVSLCLGLTTLFVPFPLQSTQTTAIVPSQNSYAAPRLLSPSVNQPLLLKYKFPRQVADDDHEEPGNRYTIATDTTHKLKIMLPTIGYLRVATPDSIPAYLSEKHIVLSFKIQHTQKSAADPYADNTLTAYEIFSRIHPEQEPLSYVNGCPIIGFKFSKNESLVFICLSSKKHTYCFSTGSLNKQKNPLFQQRDPEDLNVIIDFEELIPFTSWSILHCRFGKCRFVYLRSENQTIYTFQNKLIHTITPSPVKNKEAPILVLHLADNRYWLCYIEGDYFEDYGEIIKKTGDLLCVTWEPNQLKTGYEISIQRSPKQEANSQNTCTTPLEIREILKRKYRSIPPSPSSSTSESSNNASPQTSPQSSTATTQTNSPITEQALTTKNKNDTLHHT